MRTALLLVLTFAALFLGGCEAERTGPNSVEISTDTAATAEASRETSEAAGEVREGAQDAAQATETALREGARQTGTALEEAGKEVQQHSKPGNQP